MPYRLIEGPDSDPLKPAEVRARLGYGAGVTDAMLKSLIAAATAMIDGPDGWLGRALMTQTWALTMPRFPDECRIQLLLQPLQSVVGVTYFDGSGVQQTVASEAYSASDEGITLRPRQRWPVCGSSGIEIQFVAGFGDEPSDVPEPIRCAIAMQVGFLKSIAGRNPLVVSESVVGVGSINYSDHGPAPVVLDQAVTALLRRYRIKRDL